MSAWDFFNSNVVQNIIMVITVAVTIWIYFLQRKAARRDAARVIVIQIDSISQKMELLIRAIENDASKFDAGKLWQIESVIENNEWIKYRHLFVKKLHYNEIVALNNFYDDVVSVRFQQEEIRKIISETNKNFYIKYSEISDKELEETKPQEYIRVSTLYLQTIQMQYEKIRNSRDAIPYARLKKIAKI